MAKTNIKTNVIYQTIYQIVIIITPFITAPYISRVLGAGGVGIQSYTASIQYYFTLFAVLGTASYGAREISRSRDDKRLYSKLFWEIEFMTFGTGGISLIGWLLMCAFSTQYKLYYIVMIPNILATIFDISWLYTGLENFKLIIARNLFFRILGIVLMFLIVKTADDLLLYIALNSITGVVSSLSLWTYLPKVVHRPVKGNIQIRRHIGQTLVYFVPTIATSIYTVLDKTLIGLITKDEAQNGYYAQADKIIGMAKSVSFTAINSVVGVRTAYLFKQKKFEEVHNRIEYSINYILFIGGGCMFGIMGVAENFVPIFFGNGYEPVTTLLYIFSPIIVIIGVSNCLGSQYYTPIGKRAESSKYLIAGSCVNLVLNCILIPFKGAVGAAIASIIAEGVITVLYLIHCEGYLTLRVLFRSAWKKFVAGTVMLFAVVFIGKMFDGSIFTLALQVCCGAAVYAGMLCLLRDKWFCATAAGELSKIVNKLKRNGE